MSQEFSLKSFFVPFTTTKAIHWIIFIGLIVFCNIFFNGFVWDDQGQIVTSSSVHSLSNIWSFFFSSPDANGNLIKIQAIYYRPLMATMFTIVYWFFGPHPFFFHVVSFLFHIGITIILFFIFRKFFKPLLAFFLTIIFLIHPLNSEAISYISAYNDLMYMFFGMLSLLILQKKILSIKRISVIAIFLFLSLLSKESGFLFIPILIYFTFVYQRKYVMKMIIAIFIIVTVYLILRTTFYTSIPQDKILSFSPYLHMSFLQHLINIPKLFFYYISNFIFPSRLAIAQHWSVEKITLTDFYFPLFILLSFIISHITLLIHFFKKNKEVFKSILFFSLWFWIGIVLYMQFIPLDMTVADRWFYFPIIGLLGLLGVSIQSLKIKRSYTNIVLALVTLCLLLLGLRTIVRNANWHDEYTLYTHDMQIEKNSFDIENLLGIVLYNDGEIDQAKTHFEKSITLWPCSYALGNLGYLYEKQKEYEKAEKPLKKSITCTSQYKSYGNLIVALYNQHKFQEAKQYATQGLQEYPGSSGLYFLRGLATYELGGKDAAIEDLTKGFQLSNNPEIRGVLQQMQNNQKVSDAIAP
jgi:Tfp pilus assembly protein PilF